MSNRLVQSVHLDKEPQREISKTRDRSAKCKPANVRVLHYIHDGNLHVKQESHEALVSPEL